MKSFRDKANIEAVFPLSAAQQGLLAHHLLQGRNDPYYVQRVFEIEGNLQPEFLERAWAATVMRHAILRCEIRWRDLAQPLHVCYRDLAVAMPRLDWSRLGREEQLAALRTDWLRCRARGDALSQQAGPDIQLIRLSAERYWLVWRFHHLQLDGWSKALVLGDVMACYERLRRGETADPAVAPSYQQYVRWLQSAGGVDDQAWWRRHLDTAQETTLLPWLPVRGDSAALQADLFAERRLQLGRADTQRLEAFASRHTLTPSVVVQAAWAWLLARRAHRRDVVFGLTVSGRTADLDRSEEIAGLLIQTVPHRIVLRSDQDVLTWLQEVRATHLELQSRRPPLANSSGRPSLIPGFDSAVIFENYPVDRALLAERADGLKLRPCFDGDLTSPSPIASLRFTHGRTHYPLNLVIAPGESYELIFAYDRRRFTDDSIAELAGQFRATLPHLLENPLRKLGELRAPDVGSLGDVSLDPMSHDFGRLLQTVVEQPDAAIGTLPLAAGTISPLPAVQPPAPGMLERIESRLELRGERLWQVGPDGQLSGRQWWQRAGELAAHLQGLGVGAECAVAVCLPRGVALATSLLGIWRAGAVYVPLDASQPAQRLEWQLSDSGARWLIAEQRPQWCPPEVAVISPRAGGERALRAVDNHPHQAAYRIYTSGSSGRPKGVTISHAAMQAYVQGMLEQLPADIERAAYVSTPAADLGHTVLLGALWSGWTLHWIDEGMAFDAQRLGAYMQQQRIEVLKIVPSHLQGLLAGAGAGVAQVLPERVLIVGGEACPGALARQIQSLRPQCQLLNHYGPSETTVGVIMRSAHAVPEGEEWLPLGRALSHARIELLDVDGNRVPRGGIGELCIGGAGVGRGYHGRPGLSAERFVPDPCGSGERLYRSGDRARRRADGNLEFLGRLDEQVKIRGHRVEPQEVSQALQRIDGVREAVTVARADEAGRLRLLSYVTGEGLDPATLREQLRQWLPEALLPASVQVLGRLPLTPNGKLDREALPQPQAMLAGQLGPRDEAGARLLEIWQQVLGRTDFGVTDNFFELGGDSVMCLQIVGRARSVGINLEIRNIFETPTVAALLAYRTRPQLAPESSGTPEHALRVMNNWMEAIS